MSEEESSGESPDTPITPPEWIKKKDEGVEAPGGFSTFKEALRAFLKSELGGSPSRESRVSGQSQGGVSGLRTLYLKVFRPSPAPRHQLKLQTSKPKTSTPSFRRAGQLTF